MGCQATICQQMQSEPVVSCQGNMEANASFEEEEAVNRAHDAYDGQIIPLFERGVTLARTAFYY